VQLIEKNPALSILRSSRITTTPHSKELVGEKMKGHTVVAKEAERPAGGNVVNLMDALKPSI
jgi:non-homologous end joining protein Ku